MAAVAMVGSVASPKIAQYNPTCHWKHEQDCDILEVLLSPGFKNDHLIAEYGDGGTVRISGEGPEGKINKEVLVPGDYYNYNTNEFEARYKKGILRVTLPKNKTRDPAQDSSNLISESNPSSSAEEKDTQKASSQGNVTKFAINVAAVVAVVSVIGVFSYMIYSHIKRH
ncbi:unnamed protein product [Cuscuta europaea]|uniref:SHSP domain-containing protein n=1 Tax=Cuscuta europaea TaxID=41803 RepID=A0A9P0YJG6_CUSEU|nr:unnamed protein product [Cuscuta europaea]